MKRLRISRPSPAVIVAAVAIIAALAGTAIADPSALTSALNGKEKKQTRNIAKDEIGKAAPGLSVAHAGTANNANTLGGSSLANVKPVSGFGQSASVISSLGGSYVTVAQATITTTANSTRILASGSAELTGADSDETGQCQIDIDGDSSLAYEVEPDDIGTGNQIVDSVNFATTRPPGTYTGRLNCRASSGTVGKDDAAINLIGIPL
jgi:hypothetical protein